MKLLIFLGILQVQKFEFLKFRILEILNFHPCLNSMAAMFYFIMTGKSSCSGRYYQYSISLENSLKSQDPIRYEDTSKKYTEIPAY